MANMTIENIGQFINSGNVESISNGGMQVQAPEIPGSAAQSTDAGAESFSKMLSDTLEKVNEAQNQADLATKELVAGRNKNIHETMLLLEKADMSLRMMMQVRNKVIDAYREIMRMQV